MAVIIKINNCVNNENKRSGQRLKADLVYKLKQHFLDNTILIDMIGKSSFNFMFIVKSL